MELNRRNRVSGNKSTPKPAAMLLLFLMLLFLLSFSSSISTTSSASPDKRCCCSSAKAAAHTNLQHYHATRKLPADGRRVAPPELEGDHDQHRDLRLRLRLARRELGGPGSSPPRCASKCGNCTPCTAVHVPVPPGTPVTAEYYPEAWRCKCGNKLYMP